MDIQAVIVSIDELNKTKEEIANAIRAKGVTSQGRFSSFVNEINAIQTGSGSGDYQYLVSNLNKNNIFKQKNRNEMEPVGLLKDTFEKVETNRVIIYSLYDIENVKVADGLYKARVNKSPFKSNFNLMVDGNPAGLLSWNTLTLGIVPKESENPNGSVVIKYTTNGKEYSVTMPVQDYGIVKPNDNSKSVYWLIQDIFNPDIYEGDLRQVVSVEDANTMGATFYSRSVGFQTHQSRPAIFDKLDTVAGYSTVDAILTLNRSGNTVESIPVKLARNIFAENIPLDGGGNGAVLEFDNNNLIFHYSNTKGQLSTKFIISKTGSTNKTDADIVQKIKELNKGENGYLGIAMYSDGSPITIAKAKEAGML